MDNIQSERKGETYDGKLEVLDRKPGLGMCLECLLSADFQYLNNKSLAGRVLTGFVDLINTKGVKYTTSFRNL